MSHCSVCVATTIFPDNLIFFQDFLDGLYYQTYKDFDIILYNDGCNEDELTKKLDGFNFDIISTPSINSIAQIRHYIFEYLRKKNYKIIFFCDSDDFFNENRIAKSLEMHLTGSDIVFNDLNLVDQKSKLIIKNYWAERFKDDRIEPMELLKYNFLGLGNTSINSDILKTELKFKRDFLMVDWAFYLQIILKNNNLKISFSDIPISYRQHDNNAIGLKKPWDSELIKKRIRLKIKFLEFYKYLDHKVEDEIENSRRMLKLLSESNNMKKHLEKLNTKNLFWFEETIIDRI